MAFYVTFLGRNFVGLSYSLILIFSALNLHGISAGQLKVKPESLNVTLGDRADFTCCADSNTTIRWRHELEPGNGQEVCNGRQCISENLVVNLSVVNCSIISILKTTEKETGIYTCNAFENKQGVARLTLIEKLNSTKREEETKILTTTVADKQDNAPDVLINTNRYVPTVKAAVGLPDLKSESVDKHANSVTRNEVLLITILTFLIGIVVLGILCLVFCFWKKRVKKPNAPEMVPLTEENYAQMLNEIKIEHENFKSAKRISDDQLAENRTLLDNLATTTEEAQNTVDTLSANVLEATRIKDNLAENLVSATTEAQHILENLKHSLTMAQNSDIYRLVNEAENKYHKLQQMVSEVSPKQSNLESIISDARRLEDSLKKIVSDAERKQKNLELATGDAQDKQDILKKTLSDAERKQGNINHTIADADQKQDNLSFKVLEAQNKRDILERTATDAEGKQKDLDRTIVDARSVKNELDKTKSDAKFQKDRLSNTIRDARIENEELRNNITDAKIANNNLEKTKVKTESEKLTTTAPNSLNKNRPKNLNEFGVVGTSEATSKMLETPPRSGNHQHNENIGRYAQPTSAMASFDEEQPALRTFVDDDEALGIVPRRTRTLSNCQVDDVIQMDASNKVLNESQDLGTDVHSEQK